MLYDPKVISKEISDIVQRICENKPRSVEVGLINLANTGSVIVDKSRNMGWEAYAKPENGEKFPIIVHFSEAFNTYDKLRNEFLQIGIEVTKGKYDYFMDIPQNAKQTPNRA